ncbi:MAG: acyl-CoA dehydrogenase family protein [Planctomycetota bacterium]|jgi:alkylation response protein AidB-like acyl-CoA dehydrogenase
MELSEEQLMMRETVRRFALEEVEPTAIERDREHKFSEEIAAMMAEMGLMGICIPEEYGGAGMDDLCYYIAVEELGRVCGSTGLTLAAHISLGTYPIYAWASEEQRKKYVPDLAAGKHFGAFGLTEPNAGSDAGGTQAMALRKGDRYVLNGTKIFITNALHSKTFIVTAKTDKSKGTSGITAFIVERDAPGFAINEGPEKLGMRASEWGELVFDNVEVPVENVMGEEGDGFKVFMKTLDGGRISIGALALGIAQGALDKAVEYAKMRVQFGKPIIEHQGVGFKLADMAANIEAARLLVYNAARLKMAKKPFSKEAAIAKLFASEMAVKAASDAIQIHGGYGYSVEYQVERYYRDAKLCTIGEGTSEIQKLVIARTLAKS